ncbi:MAG TPA: TIGR03435 family protein [Acidobacteriaceae bacterium]|nr:TIGR03435 family protein [Acidobacteriaceae bacterium]
MSSTRRSTRLLAATFLCLLASSSALTQSPTSQPAATSPAPAPAFEVATIKPQAPGQRNMFGVMETPDGLNASAASLSLLVQVAYGLAPNRVSGGPDWAHSEHFDIQAKMSGADVAALNALTPPQQKLRRQQMLQSLLADRFKLKAHRETKQVPTFDLVATKDISKLKVATTDADTKMNKDGTPATFIRPGKDSTDFTQISMSSFAHFLSGPMSGVGRPVTDKTALTSNYNFTLNWSQHWVVQPGTTSATLADDDAPSIFTALNELGLKLQLSNGPIETVVIDHAERPTAD